MSFAAGIPRYYNGADAAFLASIGITATGLGNPVPADPVLLSRHCEITRALNEPRSIFSPSVPMIDEWRMISSLGDGIKWRAFKTTVYHHPYPEIAPKFPGVSKDAEAIVVAFPGSGLTTASGRNFMQLGNVLARRGVSLVSFDYPFHREGPKDEAYMDADAFHAMAMGIVEFYKSTHKPVFLLGHSQGPLPIQELLFMDPNLASGALLFSPGGASSREMLEHYVAQDAIGAFDSILSSKTQIDDDAEAWEMAMDAQAKTIDLEVMPTEIPVWVIAGEDDPWSTSEMIQALAAKFPNGKAEIVPDTGHNVFHTRLANNEALLPARTIEMIEMVLGKKLPKRSRANASSKVLYFHSNSEMFRGWFTAIEERGLDVFVNDRGEAKQLMEMWNFWLTSLLFNLFNPAPRIKLSTPIQRRLWRMEDAQRADFRSSWTSDHVAKALRALGQALERRASTP